MKTQMDAEALSAFMHEVYEQAASDYIIDEVGPGVISLRLRTAYRHLRPGGTVSGPAMFALADVAAYLVTLAMIGPEALAVTTNCSIDFMRKPVAGTDLIAKCRLLKLGRTLSVSDVLIYSEGLKEPVAKAGLTYSIPPRKSS